jgi:lysozyme
MTPSQQCFSLVCPFEGLFLKAYGDSCVPPVITIGYGRTVNDDGTKIRSDQVCSEGQALSWLGEDLEHEGWHFLDVWLTQPLKQNEFDALTSFIFNAGCGTFKRKVLPHVNAGDMRSAAEAMKSCVYAAGNPDPLAGLIRRRQAETCLLLGDIAGMNKAING